MVRPSIADNSRRLSFTSFRLSDIDKFSDRDVKLSSNYNDDECPSTENTANQAQDETLIIALEESKRLNQLKYFMLLMFVLVGVGASTATFFIVNDNTNNDGKAKFQDSAQTTVHGFLTSAQALVWSTYTTSVSYTSHFHESNSSEWPFVTLPNFSVRTIGSLATSKSNSISFAPILMTEELRLKWEQYASASQYMLHDLESAVVLAEIHLHRSIMEVGPYQSSSPVAATIQLNHQDETLIDTKNSIQQRRNTGTTTRTIEEGIYRFSSVGTIIYDPGPAPYFPIWQTSPASPSDILGTMYNQASHWTRRTAILEMMDSKRATFTDVVIRDVDYDPNKPVIPRTFIMFPVLTDFASKEVAGSMTLEFDWSHVLSKIVPDQKNRRPMVAILENTCQQAFTFRIEGQVADYLGEGDQHDRRYDDQVVSTDFEQFGNLTSIGSLVMNASDNVSGCLYRIHLYPSSQNEQVSNRAMKYSLVVASNFLFAIICFLIYDCRVEKRQTRILQSATRTSAIVHQLFPKQVRERMLRRQDEVEQQKQQRQPSKSSEIDHSGRSGKVPRRNYLLAVPIITPKLRLKNFLSHSPALEGDKADGTTSKMHDIYNDMEGEPIANFFPHTTIMFADIAGFTAWSSEREPSQVFKLLESLYKSFDEVAKKLGVFKVETIGDCYVAVTGLPDPNKDHAVVMARFAFECLYHMHELTKRLENALGPGTTDLALRVGLHSGPVTAGVLRGEKSRFQLFGDTMNTAARMESTGQKNRIHVSQDTADLIISAGKLHWLRQREGLVTAKGKGEMQTFWLKPRSHDSAVVVQPKPKEKLDRILSISLTGRRRGNHLERWADLSLDDSSHQGAPWVSTKKARLVNWNVDLLLTLLTKVVARRKSTKRRQSLRSELSPCAEDGGSWMILDEVTEIIDLPGFDPNATQSSTAAVVLGERVKRQLRDYITRIAAMYHDVPFHNFEHASHVTMSANKLLKRILYPDDLDYQKTGEKKNERARAIALDLHYSTYGISSDPLTQFSIVFSALIHDVDHTGLPNAQLVKERAEVALKYQNKSVAEQHSVAIALEMLAEPKYDDLRSCIYGSTDEKKRFRQLVVNAVMTTDIMDMDQQSIRKTRWDLAFNEASELAGGSPTDYLDINRKATSVIEHIIQASDVAHTMQHWRIYRKWNERLFHEMTVAFQAGRAEKDPAEGWYEGEIWFFDNYIIPLAKKLKECGVFGVSSDEYLTYALENRKEWEVKGRIAVREMIENVEQGGEYNKHHSSMFSFSDLHKQSSGLVSCFDVTESPTTPKIV